MFSTKGTLMFSWISQLQDKANYNTLLRATNRVHGLFIAFKDGGYEFFSHEELKTKAEAAAATEREKKMLAAVERVVGFGAVKFDPSNDLMIYFEEPVSRQQGASIRLLETCWIRRRQKSIAVADLNETDPMIFLKSLVG